MGVLFPRVRLLEVSFLFVNQGRKSMNPVCRRMSQKVLGTMAIFSMAAISQGQITSLNLANYQHTATLNLSSIAAAEEASAIAFNQDNGHLFVLGDEGDAILEITTAGSVVSTMTLSSFDDTEGLTYIGSGQFVITEERLQNAYRFTYVAGGSIDRSSMAAADLGPTVGNVGIEGIAYEFSTGTYFTAKEKTPLGLFSNAINFTTGTANVTSLFNPASLGVLDLSDIALLSNVASLTGTADQDNLLLYSQESAKLMEVTRSGLLLSTFDFSSIADDAEGVTIDQNGVIYVAGEAPAVYVLTPVPEPTSMLLLAIGGITLLARRR